MKFFANIIKLTLTYKIIDVFKTLYYYIRDYRRVSDTLYSDQLKKVFKKYLNLDIEVDWIGRLYGVINPMVDINGHFDVNNSIIELNDDLSNNNDQIQYWAFKQLKLIGKLFEIENLYDYIYMNIEHVGPATGDNYLIVFDIASRKDFSTSFKKMFIQMSIYLIIAAITIMCI